MIFQKERKEAAKAISNTTEHAELLERINQLNILRESNATLRAEGEAQARKARQPETSLNHLQSELDPLKEEAKTLRAELGAKDAQIRRLEDENRQWKERNAQLLTKVSYDPAPSVDGLLTVFSTIASIRTMSRPSRTRSRTCRSISIRRNRRRRRTPARENFRPNLYVYSTAWQALC